MGAMGIVLVASMSVVGRGIEDAGGLTQEANMCEKKGGTG